MVADDLQVLAANLRRIRGASDLTQADAAEASGLSRSAYRNLEAGTSTPRAQTLQLLAEAFSVSVNELIATVPVLEGVRFRSKKRIKLREHILAKAGRALGHYSELEKLLGEREEFFLRDLREKPIRKGSKRAQRTAEKVREKLGFDEEEPVRDICGLLESCGIKVIALSMASDSFFGLSVANPPYGPAIVVNNWERISVERWIFSAAHELGHLLLHIGAYDRSKSDENAEEERQANEFASYFLMPPKSFTKEWVETRGMPFIDRVLKVKRIFRVSYSTVLYRLQQKTNKQLWPLFHAHYKRKTGRSLTGHKEPEPLANDAFAVGAPASMRRDEPENLSPLDFVEDRRHRLVRKAIESEKISMSRGAEILGMSLEEMREISSYWINVWPARKNARRHTS